MKKITSILSAFKLSNLKTTFNSLSNRERFVLSVLLIIFSMSTLSALYRLNKHFSLEVPRSGGTLTEGIIGVPRFINPLLAISDADRDLTSLVYSGLLRATPEGNLIEDLAESYSVSEDGTIYTFILRDNLEFHDGTKITTDDIEFTIQKAQDPTLKSAKRASWDGVVVEKIDRKTISFILKQPYSPFLENTTLGILPKHIWQNAQPEQFSFSQYNIEPIGSGAYKLKSVERNSSGIPNCYNLVANKDFTIGKPYITNLKIKFFNNEKDLIKALRSEKIDTVNAITPEEAQLLSEEGYEIILSPLPRIFGVFFNQNENAIFANRILRKILSFAINREIIIDEVLLGYGTSINGPIPPGGLGYIPFIEKEIINENATTTSARILEARVLLEENGWKLNEESDILEKKSKQGTQQLVFSISTSDAPELKASAEIVKREWEKLGAQVELKIFESGNLNQNVIRTRNYDTLLFGEIIGRGSDPFAFWHSSQRLDPGLNIANYTNITVDKLLEQGRVSQDKTEREEKYLEMQEEMANDYPAVFIFSPDFIYINPEKVKGVRIGQTTTPSERFLNIYEWYINTDRIWKFSTNN